jgi:uncharacterized protein YndB with AHSA1/START domain
MTNTNFFVNKDNLTVVIDSVFDAPKEKVFNAFIDPASVKNWWGPASLSITIEQMDVKEGGKWRIIHKDSGGKEFGFNGVFKKIDKPNRIVRTFNFEGIPGNHELIETASFDSINGQTRITATSKYQNIEDLEGMVNSGMESGSRESFERLAKLVEKS